MRTDKKIGQWNRWRIFVGVSLAAATVIEIRTRAQLCGSYRNIYRLYAPTANTVSNRTRFRVTDANLS